MEKIIEICNNLIGTINRIPKDRKKPPMFENDMFNPPQVNRKKLLSKLKYYKDKYEIKDEQLLKLSQ